MRNGACAAILVSFLRASATRSAQDREFYALKTLADLRL
jgi:hypothetical protein